MLLRFWAENVLSLRERQELSLVATELNEGSARSAGVRVDGGDIQVVPVVAIYGSNASGKSNVLAALNMMRNAVLGSVTWASKPDPVRRVPFLLDESSTGRPSVFGVEIAIDGVRYRYGFGIDDKRVVTEWLHAYPTGRKQVWFERDADATPQLRFRGEGLRGVTAAGRAAATGCRRGGGGVERHRGGCACYSSRSSSRRPDRAVQPRTGVVRDPRLVDVPATLALRPWSGRGGRG